MRLTDEKVIVVDIGYLLDISDYILLKDKEKYAVYIETQLLNIYKQLQEKHIQNAILILLRDGFGFHISNWVAKPITSEEAEFFNYVKDYVYDVIRSAISNLTKKSTYLTIETEYYVKVIVVNTQAHIILSKWSKHGKSTFKNNHS